jgi:hypothetical protein
MSGIAEPKEPTFPAQKCQSLFSSEASKMSYSRDSKRHYETPPVKTGQGKPGFKKKGSFEQDLISKSSESQIKTGESSE